MIRERHQLKLEDLRGLEVTSTLASACGINIKSKQLQVMVRNLVAVYRVRVEDICLYSGTDLQSAIDEYNKH